MEIYLFIASPQFWKNTQKIVYSKYKNEQSIAFFYEIFTKIITLLRKMSNAKVSRTVSNKHL